MKARITVSFFLWEAAVTKNRLGPLLLRRKRLLRHKFAKVGLAQTFSLNGGLSN